ncbi:MAG: 4-hydroxy-3-methylbut-2-enyl diphosphate reductase [Desulfuromonas sp.]|uniref:4-hydroxy-3-methylbut-2-enyl diphosphate reductase n=1 Tax=Desulfuromonas sp. TaxID=892 RepID=UPI000CAB32BE|nr:4-hydroxy-3-methylbut-2-enyl diphosphate reductase [Desulfuromonas sp.]PLX85127.1 MAG: 4-hydroxy-3-methylbut-2-enyl diphosphate reductase [Desulfuromonas sp.]
MKILLAKSAGFCFGVKRAINMAYEATEKHEHLCSLGPIIHSPQVVEKLREKGVRDVESLEEGTEGAVIVRSHGVTAQELRKARSFELEIVDATCPFVKKAQEHAASLNREGYAVVLVGEEEHPEVQGILSYAEGGGEVFVVADRKQAEGLPRKKRLGVVAQTTQSLDNLRQVVEVCLEKSQELRVFNTICDATALRQDEAQAIARQVEVMLVLGGYNSANTNRLAEICLNIQPRTHHVETAAEIDPDWFHGVESVGITAGASTPLWIIDEVLEKVRFRGK